MKRAGSPRGDAPIPNTRLQNRVNNIAVPFPATKSAASRLDVPSQGAAAGATGAANATGVSAGGADLRPPIAPQAEPQKRSMIRQQPKEYLDIKAVKDINAQTLYLRMMQAHTARWCQPPPDPMSPTSPDVNFRPFTFQGGCSSEEALAQPSGSNLTPSPPSAPSHNARKKSKRGSMISGRANAAPLLSSGVGAAKPPPLGFDIFSDHEDSGEGGADELESIAQLQMEQALHFGAMQVLRQDGYAAQYTHGVKRQYHARADVAAYGKELGTVEAVSQLPPLPGVLDVLKQVHRKPEESDAIVAAATQEGCHLREMHMQLIGAKLMYHVEEELRLANLALRSANGEVVEPASPA